ncbi:hypothetical protein F5050DRAFT_1716165 [Lentinula boryana]|uniref:Uncharacterized protein n=1 Tax=Lentinula boryana TaxID=40481 RepID=A0ABQ8PZ50_9AGAR|nr:hypothetical protein F5050DRAFT_1716165 [Lentinula boryana]
MCIFLRRLPLASFGEDKDYWIWCLGGNEVYHLSLTRLEAVKHDGAGIVLLSHPTRTRQFILQNPRDNINSILKRLRSEETWSRSSCREISGIILSTSHDEFHDASEDGLEISHLQVELPNSRDTEHYLGKTTGDVIWRTVDNDSERCKTRLRKTWSMTTTTVFAAGRKDILEKVLMNHYIVVDCALEQIPFVCVTLAGGTAIQVVVKSLRFLYVLEGRAQWFYGMSWITIEAHSFAQDVNSNNGELNDMQCYWNLSLSTGMGYS